MTNKDLDLEIDKLINTEGKYYMAYGMDYAAETHTFNDTLKARRAENFKKWLKEHYEKR